MFVLVHVGVVQAAWERVGCITEKPAFVQDLYVCLFFLVCSIRSNVSVYSLVSFVRSKLCKRKKSPPSYSCTLSHILAGLLSLVFPAFPRDPGYKPKRKVTNLTCCAYLAASEQ